MADVSLAAADPELTRLNIDDVVKVDKASAAKRQTWASQIDFIMSAVGCAVGLGNIWRFPYLCYKNGGGAFLIPYLVCFFVAAAPLFLVETSLGQYTSSGCVRAWKIAPAFQGIGLASQMIVMWANIYYIVVIAWALYYVAMSLTSELPWATCGNSWNSDRCFVTGMSMNRTSSMNCSTAVENKSSEANCTIYNATSEQPRVDAVVEFWEKRVLHISGGIDEPGKLVPGLAVSLLVAWILVYVCICRGVRWTGKIVYFTVLFPYVLLTVLFVRGVTLDGAVDGIIFYLRPDFSRLADAQVWIDGGTQVLYSIGIAQGFMVTLGSYNTFHSNSFRNSVLIITVNCLTSLYGGMAVFAILGFMAKEMDVPIHNVVNSGPGLVFLAYPKAVTQMSLSPFWSALFFLMILFVGLDSEFVAVEVVLTPLIDKFPQYLYRPRNRMIFIALYCISCYLLGLTMVTEGGVYVFRLIDYYCASGLALLTIAFTEIVIIGWVFGTNRFCDAIEMMIGHRLAVSPWLKICWKFLAPIVLLGIFLFELVMYKPLTYSSTYEYPTWALVLGVCFTLSSTICIPGYFLYSFFRAEGSIRQRWRDITTPILKKHQIHAKWREHGYTWVQEEYRSHDAYSAYQSDDSL